MSRRVKEFIDISDFASLDELIEILIAIRDGLPAFAEAELRLKGDDVFGRKLSISYMREQNEDVVRDLHKDRHRWRNPVWREKDGSFAEW